MRYYRLSFTKAINSGLQVMDATAFTLCRDNDKPMGAVCLRTMPASHVVPAGDRVPFTGTPVEVAMDVDEFAAAGMSHILFSPAITDFDQLTAEMRPIAQDVRPLVG